MAWARRCFKLEEGGKTICHQHKCINGVKRGRGKKEEEGGVQFFNSHATGDSDGGLTHVCSLARLAENRTTKQTRGNRAR